jgi:hypothetical protein
MNLKKKKFALTHEPQDLEATGKLALTRLRKDTATARQAPTLSDQAGLAIGRGGTQNIFRGSMCEFFIGRNLRTLLLFVSLWLLPHLQAAESWQQALSQMPLRRGATRLERTNCVEIMLESFRSNDVVKAVIFMPGATDEFYMFHRARASLTNAVPTLLDAVRALTSQTLIRASFRPPFLLLHTDEDPLEPLFTIESQQAAAKLRSRHFLPHASFNDRDWDFIQPRLGKTLKAAILPGRYRYSTWHFYRHSFAAWNLDGWEALEAVALAGKTSFHVRKGGLFGRPEVLFEGDERVRATPKLDGFVPDN